MSRGLWFHARLAMALVIGHVSLVMAQVPASSHVVLVVLENQSFGTVTNSNDSENFMPWLIAEGNQYGFAANYSTNSNGSLLDYLWLSSGSCHASPASQDCRLPQGTHAFGCTGTRCAGIITDDNIFRQLIANGISWKVYAESLPAAGYLGGKAGDYDASHNAAKWYSDVVNSPKQQQNIVPFAPNFANDLAANKLPRYSIVIPNILHDAHTGTPAQADAWMQAHLSPLLQQSYFQTGGDGLLIITFDNGDNDNADLVYTAVIGPKVKPDFVSHVAYKHQNALRTMLDALEIPDRPGASASAAPMSDFFPVSPPDPQLSSPALQFGQQVLNVATSNTVMLTNAGVGGLDINSITTTAGSDFSQSNDCGGILKAGASCTVTVTFKPTVSGPRLGRLTFKYSPGPAQVVDLTGTGTAIGFSPSLLAFGGQIVGTSSTQALSVSNPGSLGIPITDVSVSAGFSQTNDCVTLRAGGTCMVTVTFAPLATGAVNGAVTLSYGETQTTASLSAIGTDFSLTPQSASSVTINAGQTAAYNLSASGSTGFSGTLNVTCSGAPAGTSCAVTPTMLSLNGTTAADLTVSIPTVAGRSVVSLFRFDQWPLFLGLAVWLAGLLVLLVQPRVRMRYARIATWALGLGLLTSCAGVVASSPTSQASAGTPAGTYNVVVTATSGSVSRSAGLILKVN